MNERIPLLREKARSLPLDPGVYIMRDESKKIIYIGKAKHLRNRVSSYFRSIEKHVEKVYRMVQNAYDFDYIVTASEFEALVLECSMIKQYKPKYNILLKDDKGYHYIHVGGGKFPKITGEKMKLEDGGIDLGPYTSSYVVKQTVEEVNKVFQLPTCKRKFPEDFRKGRPCLNYHIKQCMGLCRGKIGEREYGEILAQCMEFIKGGSKGTMELLTQQMEQAAENLDFEKAAILRDRIRAINRVADEQNVVFTKEPNQDVIALARGGEECCAVVLKFRDQRLVDKEDYDVGEISGLESARSEFLLSYYNNQQEIPKIISLDGECEDNELIARYLSEKIGHKVSIGVPERGEKLRLVKMAVTNAAEQLARKSERTSKEVSALDELARLLGLENPPHYIESYDISNMGSETVVAGMVVFENGRPLKSAYKKFNIKTIIGTDDYGSMREVIRRRLSHYDEEKESGKGFGRLPDLILLDGGKGHVAAVLPVVVEMGFSIPVYGMVKDDRHRTRAIAKDGGEIAINSTRSAFTLVSTIQDEVHRFSITFMKSKHKKSAFAMRLTSVPGVGDKRAQALFSHFKTQTAMKAASVEELAAAPGMTKTTAQAVYNYFHSPDAPLTD
ncbi:excinuclease ABC subunit UvrC [Ruminococcaceae bacterium OttesenSCG-928-L11]|nr:excinuclease ABC subunit UvrC [Ruminococcaceae bacterium OttesenSCG-928-L11]